MLLVEDLAQDEDDDEDDGWHPAVQHDASQEKLHLGGLNHPGCTVGGI